ncbi:MAG: aminoacyl-tRNA hydrolase [Candidatus Krumholzibacteriota bacterium]|nr:aminoacyl-tRNA hydrolase [Candidatus Krumholzibacteriota bacterium]
MNDRVSIPDDELRFRFSRSSGPGGQNVNKVATRVTLLFDVEESPSLGEEDRRRIMARLATRIGKDGCLRVVSQRHRTQRANREAAVERFAELLGEALHREKSRRPTRPSRSAREARIRDKKKRSRLKRERSIPLDD